MTARHPKATLAATICGSSLAFIDGSVVNVGLPLLARDLHAAATTLSWAVNAYALPLGALILLGGGLGDHYGRRRIFMSGLLLFTAASVVCALAPTYGWLLAGRGAQGIGAALLMPNSLALLGGAFEGEARGRAIGTWAGVGALSGALGPVLGGWLIDVAGWRSIFYINLPIAAAAMYFGQRYVEEQRDAGRESLDFIGAVLATGALALLTWALTASSDAREAHRTILVAASGGVLVLAAFLLWEHRQGESALMPFSVFKSRSFVGLNLLTWFLYGALGGLIVLLPYLLIQVEHWHALNAGAALLPVSILIGLGSRFMGRFAVRVGARKPLLLGCLLVAGGLALYARVGTGALNYWTDLLPPTLLIAAGMGLCVAPLTSAVMSSVDAGHVGLASGINNAVARIAGLAATALLGFVFAAHDSVPGFIAGFRRAALAGAAVTLLAAVCAVALVRDPDAGTAKPSD